MVPSPLNAETETNDWPEYVGVYFERVFDMNFDIVGIYLFGLRYIVEVVLDILVKLYLMGERARMDKGRNIVFISRIVKRIIRPFG